MVQRQAVADTAAAIMSCQKEMFVAKNMHHLPPWPFAMERLE